MNDQISLLAKTAQKEDKVVLGLMSGTSMDGLDLALCRLTGTGAETEISLLEFETLLYPDELKTKLQKVVSVPRCSLEDVCLMHTYLGDYTADIILDTLDEWDRKPSEVDCIASHGQTIYHTPRSKHQQQGFSHTTLQIGDGDHIAYRTGILTISDFRQKHTAAGGEGAPMAAFVDQLLFGDPTIDRLLLNIGGIANFTYLPASPHRGPISADTGPGNTLLDAAARRLLNRPYDKGGAVARKGKVHKSLLEALKANKYFDLESPKTTGPELFNWEYVQQAQQKASISNIETEHLMATLTQFTAETIADTVKEGSSSNHLEVLASGGGIHNRFLMDRLAKQFSDTTFSSFGDKYFDPDAKEAVCFAVLANEALSGEGFPMDSNDQRKRVNFGKVSFAE